MKRGTQMRAVIAVVFLTLACAGAKPKPECAEARWGISKFDECEPRKP